MAHFSTFKKLRAALAWGKMGEDEGKDVRDWKLGLPKMLLPCLLTTDRQVPSSGELHLAYMCIYYYIAQTLSHDEAQVLRCT